MGPVSSKQTQTHWKPDVASPCCDGCHTAFTLLTRRHHCRDCGGLFCDLCSASRRAVPRLGFFVPVRVCGVCASATAPTTPPAVDALVPHGGGLILPPPSSPEVVDEVPPNQEEANLSPRPRQGSNDTVAAAASHEVSPNPVPDKTDAEEEIREDVEAALIQARYNEESHYLTYSKSPPWGEDTASHASKSKSRHCNEGNEELGCQQQ